METYIQYLDRLEAKLSKLDNNYRNKETLSYQCLTISDILTILMRTTNHGVFGDFDQDSISAHQLKLEKSQTLDNLASFHFKEIELDCEC